MHQLVVELIQVSRVLLAILRVVLQDAHGFSKQSFECHHMALARGFVVAKDGLLTLQNLLEVEAKFLPALQFFVQLQGKNCITSVRVNMKVALFIPRSLPQ